MSRWRTAALLVLMPLMLTGCGDGEQPLFEMSAQTYSYDSGVLTEPRVHADAVTDGTETVYWSVTGKVRHKSRECPSLSRSKDISSGTVRDAVQSGKDRECQRC